MWERKWNEEKLRRDLRDEVPCMMLELATLNGTAIQGPRAL